MKLSIQKNTTDTTNYNDWKNKIIQLANQNKCTIWFFLTTPSICSGWLFRPVTAQWSSSPGNISGCSRMRCRSRPLWLWTWWSLFAPARSPLAGSLCSTRRFPSAAPTWWRGRRRWWRWRSTRWVRRWWGNGTYSMSLLTPIKSAGRELNTGPSPPCALWAGWNNCRLPPARLPAGRAPARCCCRHRKAARTSRRKWKMQ